MHSPSRATDSACRVSATTAPAGTLTFAVTNDGSTVTEFYLWPPTDCASSARSRTSAPASRRELVLSAPAGKYFTACKPGMVGDGIRSTFTVTDSGQAVGPTGDDTALVRRRRPSTPRTSRDQTDQLVAEDAGRSSTCTRRARTTRRAPSTRVARVHWERIETVAESFGDLDPMMDAREADLEEGQKWTGWHRIEKDLWPQRAAGLRAADHRPTGDVRRTT